MPRMPPQQSSIPASMASGRWRRGRRRCGCSRSTGTAHAAPRGCGCSASPRPPRAARACSSVRSPSEHATSRPVSACTASTASMTRVSIRSDGPRTATTMQNCVAPASRVARRRFEHLVELEQRVHVDVGRVAGRLRAERAVLRARARLGVDEALELDLGAAVREPHAVGERDEVGELVERERGDREHLVARQRTTFVEQRASRREPCRAAVMAAQALDEPPRGGTERTTRRAPTRRRSARPPKHGSTAAGGRPPRPACPRRRRKTRAPP